MLTLVGNLMWRAEATGLDAGEFALPASTAKSDKIEQSPISDKLVLAPPAMPSEKRPAPASQPGGGAMPAPGAEPQAVAPLANPATQTAAATPFAPMVQQGTPEFEWSGQGAPTLAATSGRINPSDRTIELTIPLRDGEFYLGDVEARVSPKDEISLPKDRLVQMMKPVLRTAALQDLNTISDAEGFLPLAAIKEKGLDLQFDSSKVELQISPTLDQRATGKLTVGGKQQPLSENLAKPAIFAGYLNMRAGADYSSQSFYGPDGEPSARVAFDGATRWLDVVLESGSTFDMDTGFTRGATRFVYDMPDEVLRFSAGDVSPLKTGFQGGSDLLGLSVEKSYSKLQPSTNIRPTGSRSFRIERPSNVDVMVNGYVTQRLHLRPGDYDLDDLPLSTGANKIALIIEDDVGQKRTLEFSVFSGLSLMAPGISEWSLSAGIASRFPEDSKQDLDNLYSGVEYDPDTPVVTGFYARGLTADLTGMAHLQGSSDSVMGGFGGALQTSFGFWNWDLAPSYDFEHGGGYAANVGYELMNFAADDGIKRTLRLVADYRSEDFAPVSLEDPRDDTMLTMSAMYAQELPWELAASVSGTASLGRGDDPDRYAIDMTLARNFGDAISAGLTMGYEQSVGGEEDDAEKADGFRFAFRVGYRLNQKSSIDAAYDGIDGRSQVAYRYEEGTGIGAWNARAALDRTPSGKAREPDNYGVNGALGYTANRAEISVSQHTGLAGLDTGKIDQRTSVTAGTAVAFADGRVAVGRPISGGYAIVRTHNNLPDSDIEIATSGERKIATTDFLGSALVSDVTPYSPARIPYDVSNLPVGYDLGAGAFDLFPGYKSGYTLTVGSDYTVTATGTLVDADGKPIPLLTGTVYEEGHQGDHVVTVFTNREGRFGAQGLRPGRWIIEMATEPKTRFVFDVPKDTVGLVRLETLKPAGGA